MIPGCILAGGQGRRLGGKGKAFINLSGKPLINHSIDNMKKQVSELSVNTRFSEDFNFIYITIIID